MREYLKGTRDVESDSSAKLHLEERQGKGTTQEKTSVPERSENQTSEIRTTDKDVRTLDPVLNYNGYFPLKCMVFSPELFLRLSAGQYKLFSYLSFLAWRYPIKHPAGPSCVRAALPYLARGTNLGRSAIVDYLEGLAGFGMIRCVETNKKTGNVYLITDAFRWSQSEAESSSPESESQSSTNQTTEIRTSEKHMSEVRNSNGCSPESESQSSEIRTKDLTSLSVSKLNKLSSPFEHYFTSIRSPVIEKEERFTFEKIKYKNQDLSDAELVECFKIVSDTRDAKGKPIFKKMAWLAGGFDLILNDARVNLQRRARQAENAAQKMRAAERERELEETVTPEEVAAAKDLIKSLLGQGLRSLQ